MTVHVLYWKDLCTVLSKAFPDGGISDRFHYTGFLKGDDVFKMFSISDVYVMPSVSEPFGITALEAISAGTPTIVSKTAGVSEAFQNCLRTDFWDTDEMANKIIALLRYDALRKTINENSKKEIDLFTWDRVAEKTFDVYTGVV